MVIPKWQPRVDINNHDVFHDALLLFFDNEGCLSVVFQQSAWLFVLFSFLQIVFVKYFEL